MKISKLLYRFTILGILGSSLYTYVNNYNVYANSSNNKLKITKNKKMKLVSLIDIGFYTQFIGTKGIIYTDHTLRHKLGNLSDYKNKPFKSKDIIEYQMPNGIYQYFYKIKGNGITGFVNKKYLHKYNTHKKDNESSEYINYGNTGAYFHVNNSKLNQYYTPEEISQIKDYQEQAKSIGNESKNSDVYSVVPKYKGTYEVGKLNSNFITKEENWINLFRGMYGLSPITNNTQWNELAQYGATDMAANGNVGAHFLAGINRPAFVPQDAWDKGIYSTGRSNLGNGGGPFSDIGGYIEDDGNSNPGHRDWILGGISQFGTGEADGSSALMIFDDNNNTGQPEKNIEFPRAGLFPYNVSSGYWSYALANGSFSGTPTVKVHDNTDNVDLEIADVHTYNQGYGFFNDALAYKVNSDIKLNHSYTITITGTPTGTYTYTTKLFDIGYATSGFNE